MIQIKSFFTDWHEVDKETAIKYVQYLLKNIVAMNNYEKIKYIENNRLKGITVKELTHQHENKGDEVGMNIKPKLTQKDIKKILKKFTHQHEDKGE